MITHIDTSEDDGHIWLRIPKERFELSYWSPGCVTLITNDPDQIWKGPYKVEFSTKEEIEILVKHLEKWIEMVKRDLKNPYVS